MASGQGTSTDKGVGFTVLFSLLSLVGALVMYLAPGSPASGWGFAAAVLFGSVAVAATQAYR